MSDSRLDSQQPSTSATEPATFPQFREMAGRIKSIHLKNFMHVSDQIFSFEQFNCFQLDVSGKNSKQKSNYILSLKNALSFVLGGKTNGQELIKDGENDCTLTLVINNRGMNAFQPAVYGNEVSVIRKIKKGQSESISIVKENGVVISKEHLDLSSLLSNFKLDRMPSAMYDETSEKVFKMSAEERYESFLRLTELDKTYFDSSIWPNADVVHLEKKRLQLLDEMRKAEKDAELKEKVENYKAQLDALQMWATVHGHVSYMIAQEKSLQNMLNQRKEYSQLISQLTETEYEYHKTISGCHAIIEAQSKSDNDVIFLHQIMLVDSEELRHIKDIIQVSIFKTLGCGKANERSPAVLMDTFLVDHDKPDDLRKLQEIFKDENMPEDWFSKPYWSLMVSAIDGIIFEFGTKTAFVTRLLRVCDKPNDKDPISIFDKMVPYLKKPPSISDLRHIPQSMCSSGWSSISNDIYDGKGSSPFRFTCINRQSNAFVKCDGKITVLKFLASTYGLDKLTPNLGFSNVRKDLANLQSNLNKTLQLKSTLEKKESELADKIESTKTKISTRECLGLLRKTVAESHYPDLKKRSYEEIKSELNKVNECYAATLEQISNKNAILDEINDTLNRIRNELKITEEKLKELKEADLNCENLKILREEVFKKLAEAESNSLCSNFQRVVNAITTTKAYLEIDNESKTIEIKQVKMMDRKNPKKTNAQEEQLFSFSFVVALLQCSKMPFYVLSSLETCLSPRQTGLLLDSALLMARATHSQVISFTSKVPSWIEPYKIPIFDAPLNQSMVAPRALNTSLADVFFANSELISSLADDTSAKSELMSALKLKPKSQWLKRVADSSEKLDASEKKKKTTD